MTHTNWRDISYLERGTETQQRAFAVLNKHNILENLAAFDPVMVSTVCVDLDIEGSDLDIICCHRNIDVFRTTLVSTFGDYPGFRQWDRKSDHEEVVTSFHADGFEIEIYGSVVPVNTQFAYRHLSMMEQVLEIGGEPLRNQVRALKMSGLKTEPAFAEVLELTGDPFTAFLDLERLSDTQLKELIRKST